MTPEPQNFNYTSLSDVHPDNIPHPEDPRQHKDWHKSEHVDHCVESVYSRKCAAVHIVMSFRRTSSNTGLENKVTEVLSYARKVELDIYETANDQEEYYRLVAEEMDKIKKSLSDDKKEEELRQKIFENTVTATKAEEILRQNANSLEAIKDEDLKKKLQKEYSCGSCEKALKLYCCTKCWNAVCKDCHDEINELREAKKCVQCKQENPDYEFVIIPRFG